MADGDPTECPRCKGKNFVIKTATLNGVAMYRVLECKDCWDNELNRSIDESMKNRPDLATRYSKVKLRTDYYGTVTINDLLKDDNET